MCFGRVDKCRQDCEVQVAVKSKGSAKFIKEYPDIGISLTLQNAYKQELLVFTTIMSLPSIS